VPHTKPSGKQRAAMRGTLAAGARGGKPPVNSRMFGSSRFSAVPGYPDFSNLLHGGRAGTAGPMPQIFYPSTNTILAGVDAAAVLALTAFALVGARSSARRT